ncbi:MAG: alpha/beta hydrolase [Bauldia sp.]|uniref:alpha/beta fold hydrolase n=1 Tax=Bauldia sp. TaxID=2575872 RepID=UPI001D6CFEFA|nr:alpha/beta hydrolase [Bauldia sp.]MCB1497621.1 alpha/beta hydrolase [Bauldia sp.]
MTFATFDREGVALRYEDAGGGPAVVFQHGLGADAAQVAEVFPSEPPARRITLECRSQGLSEAGPHQALSIATFADDVAALAERTLSGPAVFGGISMGAAISLRLAVRRPDLVRALVLARPAWTFEPAPENMKAFALIAGLLRTHGRDSARAAFARSEIAIRAAREAPDNLASLSGFFDRPDLTATAALLGAIAGDGPGVSVDEVRALDLPVLVLGTADDIVHPLGFAEALAAAIPAATMVTLVSKSADRDGHVAGFRTAMADFLRRLDP